MHLLVSVRDASEAAAALSGGADIIDAKEPAAGALGAVSLATFQEICTTVAGARPVSAALGDAPDAATAADLATAFAAAGAAFVKVGFAADADAHGVATVLRAAVAGAIRAPVDALPLSARRHHAGARTAVIAATFADRRDAVSPFGMIALAATCGAAGVLLDTADKAGLGLCQLWSPDDIAAWLRTATAAGLHATVAGRVTMEDLRRLRDLEAPVVGVRGAACDGDRTGRVSAARVRDLIRAHGNARSAVGGAGVPGPAPHLRSGSLTVRRLASGPARRTRACHRTS